MRKRMGMETSAEAREARGTVRETGRDKRWRG
jgi:hypothetical protein